MSPGPSKFSDVRYRVCMYVCMYVASKTWQTVFICPSPHAWRISIDPVLLLPTSPSVRWCMIDTSTVPLIVDHGNQMLSLPDVLSILAYVCINEGMISYCTSIHLPT